MSEWVVIYWAHGSKRYTAVGIANKEEAQEYAKRLREKYKTTCKIIEMPGRNEMQRVTDGLPKAQYSLW